MKKTLLLGAALVFSFSLAAQVTITKTSLITAGKTFVSYDDTAGTSIKSGGMGSLTWDFTTLNKDDSFTLSSFNPDWKPSISSLMPSANLFLQSDNEEDYTCLNITDSAMYFEGSIVDTGSGPLEVSNFGFTFLPLPITHGTVYIDTTTILDTKDSFNINAGPGVVIDSVRTAIYMAQRFEGVGHGNVKFTSGEMSNVLMVEQLRELYVKAWARFNGNWTDLPTNYYSILNISPEPDSTFLHSWWTDNSKKGLPIVQYEYAPGSSQSDEVEYIDAAPQASSIDNNLSVKTIVYPNPSSLQIKFKGISNLSNTVKIFNMNGTLVREGVLSQGVLNVADLNSGNYVIILKEKGQVISTEITKL